MQNIIKQHWYDIPTLQNITNLNNSFLFENYSGSNKGKCVSTLLNTNNWSNFVDSTYADYAIGGPTIEMWVSSWNQMYGDLKTLYCPTGNYGYYIGDSSDTTSKTYSLASYGDSSNETGHYDKLYFRGEQTSDGSNGYRLSSPAYDGGDNVLGVHFGGTIRGYSCQASNFSIRPVVRLKSEIILGTLINEKYELVNN